MHFDCIAHCNVPAMADQELSSFEAQLFIFLLPICVDAINLLEIILNGNFVITPVEDMCVCMQQNRPINGILFPLATVAYVPPTKSTLAFAAERERGEISCKIGAFRKFQFCASSNGTDVL